MTDGGAGGPPATGPAPAGQGDLADLERARAACLAASAALAPWCAGGRPRVADAKGDGSPVTEADRAASDAALAALAALAPGDLVVSEEAPPPPGWAAAPRIWFVDPIDGTREFVAGLPEFCVMVGLVAGGRPVVGAIHDPSVDRTWLGAVGAGAWVEAGRDPTTRRPIRAAARSSLAGAHELRSRFRDSPRRAAWAERVGIVRRTPLGSMGLKGVRIAAGEADLSRRIGGRTRYWDSVAPAALVLAAGGEAACGRGDPLRFDAPDLAHEGLTLCARGLLAAIRAAAG